MATPSLLLLEWWCRSWSPTELLKRMGLGHPQPRAALSFLCDWQEEIAPVSSKSEHALHRDKVQPPNVAIFSLDDSFKAGLACKSPTPIRFAPAATQDSRSPLTPATAQTHNTGRSRAESGFESKPLAMQSHHFAGHDLDLLESYVHDCVQQLPKLPTAEAAAAGVGSVQLPARCASYHTMCAAMLKEALALLTLLSPRLCRLVAQIWDLASINVYVLLQLAHAALQDAQRLKDQLVFVERFHAEELEQQTRVMQRHEQELARQRLNEQELRAELQKTRQRANRLAVENGQLRRVVSRVLDAQAAMEATRVDNANADGKATATGDDNASFCEDVAAVGEAEERELFGVDGGDDEALARIEVVHPIESYATDFEQLFQALFEGEARHVSVLNDMDRYMNSTSVALLWRYGSTEEEHQMMHKMLSASTVATQTDTAALEKTPRLLSADWEENGSEDNSDNDGEDPPARHCKTRAGSAGRRTTERDDGTTQQHSSVRLEAVAVTKRQVIPATLRAQLDSRPRIQRVLDKKQLNRVLLRLLLEKLECDARLLRNRHRRVPLVRPGAGTRAAAGVASSVSSFATPRTPLHRFMKDFFLMRYELPTLADFHMMEVVKSCLYYHEQLEATQRRAAASASLNPTGVTAGNAKGSSTAPAEAAAAPLVGCLSAPPDNLLQQLQFYQQQKDSSQDAHDHQIQQFLQVQQQFNAADVRVALFTRLCELIPFEQHTPAAASPPPVVVRGNLSACLLNAVVDVLGDTVELDPAVPSLAEVEQLPSEASWVCPRALAIELVTRHLVFIDRVGLEATKDRVATLASVLRPPEPAAAQAGVTAPTDCVAVDVFLAVFATSWLEYDQRLGTKLREGFRHQLLMSSPFASKHLVVGGSRAIVDERLGSFDNTSVAENLLDGEEEADGNTVRRTRVRRSTVMQVLPVAATAAAAAAAAASSSSPLEALAEIWTALPDESLSPLDCEELESSFRSLLEAKHEEATHRHRSSVRKSTAAAAAGGVLGSSGTGITLGGVTEKEFVFHAMQVLRRRRNGYGLRSSGRRPRGLTSCSEAASTSDSNRARGETTAKEDVEDLPVPLEKLKPGLSNDILAYVGQ